MLCPIPLHRDQRYFSGVLFAITAAFLTHVFLEPMVVPVQLELAKVALWVLAMNAGLVGLSLGILLPTLLPGVSFGISLSLVIGAFLGIHDILYLPVVGGVCSLIGILLSTRYANRSMQTRYFPHEPFPNINPLHFFLLCVTLWIGQRSCRFYCHAGHSFGSWCRRCVLGGQTHGEIYHGCCSRLSILPQWQ